MLCGLVKIQIFLLLLLVARQVQQVIFPDLDVLDLSKVFDLNLLDLDLQLRVYEEYVARRVDDQHPIVV